MSHDAEHQRKQKIVNDARTMLEEGAFDAVVVIACWQTETGSTASVHAHAGNWYAQNGLMQHLLTVREQAAIHDGNEDIQRQIDDE